MHQMFVSVEELSRAIALFPRINISITTDKLQDCHFVLEVVDEFGLFIDTANVSSKIVHIC